MWSKGGWSQVGRTVLIREDAAEWRTEDGWMMFGGVNKDQDLSSVVLIDDDFVNKG